MRFRRHAVALAAVLAIGASAGRAADPPGAYRMTVDLTDSIHALASDNPSTYDAAVQLLAGLGTAVLPTLAEALRKEPERGRVGIVEVLDQIGEPECVPLLIEAAGDPSVDVRVDALLALGALADERARPLIEKSLDDGLAEMRRAAAVACATLCRSAAALQRLARMAVHDQPLNVFFPARQALAILADDENPEVAKAARKAMEEVARPAFEAGATRPERVRAALVLADAGDAPAVAWLRDSLADETEPALRNQIIETLGEVGDASSLPILVDQAKDPTRRAVVCRALEQLANRHIEGAAGAAASCSALLPQRKK